jgi:hypothetical protein
MTPEEMLAAITKIAEGLKTDMAAHCATLDAKYGEIADSVAKMKADEAGSRSVENKEMLQKSKKDNDGDDMAEQVAADRRADSASDIRVANSLLAGLARDMNALKKQVLRPMSDLNAYADVQSKCDTAFIANGERAEPPMAGEDIIAYNIRQHRKLQKHSPKWKGVDLGLIAADRQAFENVLTEIRADAVQAGTNPVGLPEFQHRKIVQESPGGHRITSFVGTGTIFKQLSRPVRHVAYIGTRSSAHH